MTHLDLFIKYLNILIDIKTTQIIWTRPFVMSDMYKVCARIIQAGKQRQFMFSKSYSYSTTSSVGHEKRPKTIMTSQVTLYDLPSREQECWSLNPWKGTW